MLACAFEALLLIHVVLVPNKLDNAPVEGDPRNSRLPTVELRTTSKLASQPFPGYAELLGDEEADAPWEPLRGVSAKVGPPATLGPMEVCLLWIVAAGIVFFLLIAAAWMPQNWEVRGFRFVQLSQWNPRNCSSPTASHGRV